MSRSAQCVSASVVTSLAIFFSFILATDSERFGAGQCETLASQRGDGARSRRRVPSQCRS